MEKKKYEIEIRIGRNFAEDVKKIVDNPKKLPRNNIIYVDSVNDLQTLFAPKKIELMRLIKEKQNTSIKDIARKLKRKREAVSRDIHLLQSYGLIQLIRKGNKVFSVVKAEKLVIPITA